ncbi:MAG: chemotaxis protein CheW [Bacteriovoracaceae bacterium]
MLAEKLEDLEIPQQLVGFRIGDDLFGISVLGVQEVIRPQKLTSVPLSDRYIKGLINLRGQVVTAINLRELLGYENEYPQSHMNVIVNGKASLYAIAVDEILDVIEVEKEFFELTPQNLDKSVSQYSSGVYKLNDSLMTVLSVDGILKEKSATP